MTRKELLADMEKIGAYFKRYIDMNEHFKPEWEAAEKINLLLTSKTQLEQNDILEILSIISETEKQEHYNGSGWFDYKLHLQAVLDGSGFDTAPYLFRKKEA